MDPNDELPRSKAKSIVGIFVFLKFPWYKIWSWLFMRSPNNSLYRDQSDQLQSNRCPREQPHPQPIVPYEDLSLVVDNGSGELVGEGSSGTEVFGVDVGGNQGTTDEILPEGVYSASIRSLEDRIDSMEYQLRALKDVIERRMRDDSMREETINSLHAELQEYKQGLLDKTLEPSLQGMIQIYDHLTTTIDRVEDDSESVGSDGIDSFRQEIEDLLALLGVTTFSEPGQHFVAGRQRIIRTEDTLNDELIGVIKRRLRVGFESDNTVLRPESVEVYGRP